MQAITHAAELYAEATRANERRELVLAGSTAASRDTAHTVLDSLPVGITDTLAISDADDWVCERVGVSHTQQVMGRTRSAIVLDLHDATIPNAIGRATGAVDGGGLLILLTPSLDTWADQRDAFDEQLVIAPYAIDTVRNAFKSHLIETLESHPGIGLVDVDTDQLLRSGVTESPPYTPTSPTFSPPPGHRFPAQAYAHCNSRDQVRILHTFETLLESDAAVVVSAERGRGKSSVAGMAAAALALNGDRVAITAPEAANVQTTFEHATAIANATGTPQNRCDATELAIEIESGWIRYHAPQDVPERIAQQAIDVLLIDEAAGIPVPILTEFLACDRLGLTTTRFGYEGTGQGFAQRFLQTLDDAQHDVATETMTEPIRYAPGDPIESWLNHALLLDARPALTDAVLDQDRSAVTYHRWDPNALYSHPNILRQIMGLLAGAHYRTEPNDLARILDAPNLHVATLEADGTILSVALVAEEGQLDEERRMAAYRGERLRGNMLPDIFINAFRELRPASQPGLRIVRVATHDVVRRNGMASQLLADIRADLGTDAAWIGAGFGVNADLISFWQANGFVPVYLGESRNDSSGVQSLVMLDQSVQQPAARYAALFSRRIYGSLADIHRTVSPAVVDQLLRSMPPASPLSIQEAGWRGLATAAYGPGRYELDPIPARELVFYHLSAREDEELLPNRETQLLIAKVLQGRSWEHVASTFEYPSVSQSRRSLGDALATLVDRYGGEVANAERERLEPDSH